MQDETRGFKVSTASKARRRPPVVLLAVLVVVAVAAGLAIWHGTTQEPQAVATSPPAPAPQPVAAVPAGATPTVLVEQSSPWVETAAGEPEDESTPWYENLETPTPAPPTPTPSISDCIKFRWTSQQVFTPSAQVMVEINASNLCRRSISSSELWFEITGWRDGSVVQTTRGHPFESIRYRRSADIAIGLPGSADWYDEITVELVE